MFLTKLETLYRVAILIFILSIGLFAYELNKKLNTLYENARVEIIIYESLNSDIFSTRDTTADICYPEQIDSTLHNPQVDTVSNGSSPLLQINAAALTTDY